MPGEATSRKFGQSPLQDLLPTRAILGRCTTAVLLKRRRARTKHPYNRMFLMFDDGGGMEFFCTGLLLPEESMDAESFWHIVRRRRKNEEIRTAFRARLDASERRAPPNIDSFHRGAKTGKDGWHDKGIVREMLGRRIEIVFHFIEIGKRRPMRYLDFVFADGTAFEFIIFGPVYACNQLESFDLSSAIQRGNKVYQNELLALKDPDSDQIVTPINRPHQWSDLDR